MKFHDQVYKAVSDTGATLSIVACRLLKQAKIRKTKTVDIRVGDGQIIHSLGEVDVTVCLGDEQVTQHCKVLDTNAFDIVIGTDFLRRNLQVKLLSLQRPYALHCDFGSGLFSVPLELSGQKQSRLRYVNRSYGTEIYQLVRPFLENGLAALQVDLNEVQVKLFASKEQHMMQLYCSQYLNNAYRFYLNSMGLCYANPRFSQLVKVLTKEDSGHAEAGDSEMRQGATGRRQGGDRRTTEWRQEDDRKAAGKRQESDRKRQAGDRKATGELRQEGDRRATMGRQGGGRKMTGKRQETRHSERISDRKAKRRQQEGNRASGYREATGKRQEKATGEQQESDRRAAGCFFATGRRQEGNRKATGL